MSTWVILLAGGRGSRLKAPTPKVFLPLNGRPIALYSYDLFRLSGLIDGIVVVTPSDYASLFPEALIAEPGRERQDSVAQGLALVPTSAEWVLIHDAARPFLEEGDLRKLLDEGKSSGAAALGHPVSSTIKQASSEGAVVHTLDRSALWEVYTPQLLSSALLKAGLEEATQRGFQATDDLSLVELLGHPTQLVLGKKTNWKITYPEDLIRAEAQCVTC